MSKSIKIVTLSILMTACILLGYGIFGKTVNDTTKQNQELTDTKNYLIEQITNLQVDYNTLTESYKVLYQNSDEKTKQVVDLNNQIESLKKDLSTSQAKVDSLENEKTILQNQVTSLTSDVNAKSLQITELETQLSTANQNAEKNAETITSLETQITELETELETAKQNAEENAETIASLEMQITELQSQLDTAKQNAEENAQTIASLETQIESLNNELAKTKQDLETVTLELDTTKSELETANSNLSAKTSELETLQAKYDEQTKSLTEAQQTIVTLNATIVEKDNKINELVAQLNSDSDLFKKLMSGEITEVKATDFPEGLTSIRAYAFYGLSNLTNVELPSTVTSIQQYAFYGCSKLESVTGSVIKSVGSSCFYNCSLLNTIVLSLTAANDYSFYNTTSLAVDLDLTNANQTLMRSQYVFANSGIKTLKISLKQLNSKWSSYGYLFVGCKDLTTVTLTSTTATTYGFGFSESMFSGCTSLTSINFNIFSGLSKTVRFCESCFAGCGFTEIDLSAINNFTFYGDPFGNCTSLAKVTLKDNQSWFFTNSPIEEVTLVATDSGSLSIKCGMLVDIDETNKIVGICRVFNNYDFDSFKDTSYGTGYTWSIRGYCFYYKSVDEIVIPSYVTYIGNYAFNELNKIRFESVEPIAALQNCYCFNTVPSAIEVPMSAVDTYTSYITNSSYSSKVVGYEDSTTPNTSTDNVVSG